MGPLRHLVEQDLPLAVTGIAVGVTVGLLRRAGGRRWGAGPVIVAMVAALLVSGRFAVPVPRSLAAVAGAAVTLAAPGGGLYDLGIRSTVDSGSQSPVGASYGYESGTSMAAPHVAAAAALVLSIAPTLTASQVRAVLTSTARPLPNSGVFPTCTGVCGAGLLDVDAALVVAANLRPPDAPTDLVVTPGPGTVALSWTAPADDGGTDLIDYRVQRSSNGGLSWVTVVHSPSTDTALTVSGLTNGRTYLFRVSGVNHVAAGAWSASAAATPATVPGKPRYLQARRGAGQVQLTWVRPASNGGGAVADYAISRSTDGFTWTDLIDDVSTTTNTTITGLTNGTKYFFRVAAKNWAGQGLWTSVVSSTPLAKPAAPTGLTATPGNTRATANWVAPTDTGGTAITSYVVQRSSNGGLQWITVRGYTTNPSRTATGLRNGTAYLFRVAAKNKVGQSPWSDTFSVTPRTKPSAPQSVVATPGDTEVTLTWLAPKSSGGNAITAYQVEASTDGVTWAVLTSSVDPLTLTYTATGLTNGLPVRFRVAAINEAGVGSYSSVRTTTPVAPAP